ncbi:AAA ATPase central domain protein [Desulfotomaculum nigrificans CO-1-SRB]|uniref:Replication-associated recombination protein A n=1 Tax=Desulfotomaculum nigrificans (strain DSM 14880 / VKM B-2319 / CO-1-SRB) TaxID=868595 RepID=F6B9U0_DESCC|nr:replication-associated recombination protein A [Desulfotomaculum nigrificans]AEF93788.1 AAA ATPase central domain protein [Desulfotomaculum nigrificans CO-1-SRB]
MDLFSLSQNSLQAAPLAERMRPRNLDEYIGQQHIVGPGKLLRRAIEADKLGSIILYGPPGTGKTTLATIISQMTSADFVKINAVSSGVAEIRAEIKKARDNLNYYGKKTIFFIDEIHSLKRGNQQDCLLEAVEKGEVTLIGATTENPYFELNGALLSRSRIFQLTELTADDLKQLVVRALQDEERGLGMYKVKLEQAALEHLIDMAGGDARNVLNALELAVLSTAPGPDGYRHITEAVIEDSTQQRVVRYDKSGDNHYDVISAFIKSIRGSDPDAALHYYARMTAAGEDQRFIVRRLIVHASEDIGMADPQAMLMAHAAWNALETVGMPEARIPIAQCIIYLATAPKSNSVICAIDQALADIKNKPIGRVPPHLRDTHYRGAKELGHTGYKYPHNYPGHYVEQQYMPDNLQGTVYYQPSDQGKEKLIKKQTAAD